MILGGEGPLLKDNRICTLSFFKDARYLYLGQGISSLDEGIFSAEKLEQVYCASTPEINDPALKEEILHFETSDFETDPDLPFGAVGHCPSTKEDLCLICGVSCYYEYVDHAVRFLVKSKEIKDTETVTEGRKRCFDANGYLVSEGFDFVGGSICYFKDGRMITGKADIEGTRYSFSSDGALYSSRPLDQSVSITHILLIIAALPLGTAVAYGVYRIYKKKNALS